MSHARIAIAGLLALSSSAQAATFNPTFEGELVTAINTANGNDEDDTIDLGGTAIIVHVADNGGNGLPIVLPDDGSGTAHKLTIQNGTIARSAMAQFRYLEVASGADLTLDGITMTSGRAPDSGTHGEDGGAIKNLGTLTITNSTLSENAAGNGGSFGGSGGAIYSLGKLTITGSTLSGNSAGNGESSGGAIFSDGTLTITGSTLSGNSAVGGTTFGGNGGAIYGKGVSLTVADSELSGNSSTAGGVFGGLGGAINWSGSGTVTLTNSTLSANTAVAGGTYGGQGGGIYAYGPSPFDEISLTVLNSTLSGNSGQFGSAFFGKVETVGNFSVTIDNSIVSGDSPVCDLSDSAVLAAQGGSNLATDTSCGSGSFLVGGAATTAVAINLGALGNHGGPTQTMLPLSGSVAIDAGNTSICPTADQRGISRPRDGDLNGISVCDVGAVEVGEATGACSDVPANSCGIHTGRASATFQSRQGRISGQITLNQAEVDEADLANPANSDYRVCLYADDHFVGTWTAEAGSPGFALDNGTLSYKNSGNALRALTIRAGAGGGLLDAALEEGPELPLNLGNDVTAQFVDTDACWSMTWSGDEIRKNSERGFSAVHR